MLRAQKNESKKNKTAKENPYAALQQDLSAKTGLKVRVQEGKVVIAFANEDELAQIINRLS